MKKVQEEAVYGGRYRKFYEPLLFYDKIVVFLGMSSDVFLNLELSLLLDIFILLFFRIIEDIAE